MLLSLALPNDPGLAGTITVVRRHVGAGDIVMPGTKLIDFAVDRSAGAAHDCPPIAHFRLVARERGRLLVLDAEVATLLLPGRPFGLIATDPDETVAGIAVRAARVTVAGIIFHAEGWGGVP